MSTSNAVTVTNIRESVVVTNNGATVVVPIPATSVVIAATQGPQGPAGVPGPGLAAGGSTGDLLVKTSATDYATAWTDAPTVDLLGFDLAATETVSTGQLAWNADEGTIELGKLNGVTNYVGAETMVLCRNNSNTVAIPKGTAVRSAGSVGNSGRIKVAPMVADGTLPGYVFFGVTDQAITGGGDGYVTVFGKIRGINTSTYLDGDILWCNPAVVGGFTKVEPQAPNLKLPVAAVISAANNGAIFVRWTTGSRLQDLHDVEANGSKDDGDVLAWNATAGRWEAVAPPDALPDVLETEQVLTANYTIGAGRHGLSVGPVEVAAPYTVTVPAGAVWAIV